MSASDPNSESQPKWFELEMLTVEMMEAAGCHGLFMKEDLHAMFPKNAPQVESFIEQACTDGFLNLEGKWLRLTEKGSTHFFAIYSGDPRLGVREAEIRLSQISSAGKSLSDPDKLNPTSLAFRLNLIGYHLSKAERLLTNHDDGAPKRLIQSLWKRVGTATVKAISLQKNAIQAGTLTHAGRPVSPGNPEFPYLFNIA